MLASYVLASSAALPDTLLSKLFTWLYKEVYSSPEAYTSLPNTSSCLASSLSVAIASASKVPAAACCNTLSFNWLNDSSASFNLSIGLSIDNCSSNLSSFIKEAISSIIVVRASNCAFSASYLSFVRFIKVVLASICCCTLSSKASTNSPALVL